jgi:hypothetical protein
VHDTFDLAAGNRVDGGAKARRFIKKFGVPDHIVESAPQDRHAGCGNVRRRDNNSRHHLAGQNEVDDLSLRICVRELGY